MRILFNTSTIYLNKSIAVFSQRACRFFTILLITLVIYRLIFFDSAPYKPLFDTFLFDDHWEFSFDNLTWIVVTLPHTPRLEPIEKIEQQWQGTCFYRKQLLIDDYNSYMTLHFDAAMHEADVWLDGTHVGHHVGGYLPFDVDVSTGKYLTVRLRNTDSSLIPPGHQLSKLDFNYYGGLYRHVWLRKRSRRSRFDRYVRVHYENITRSHAILRVRFSVIHSSKELDHYQIRYRLNDSEIFPFDVLQYQNPSSSYDVKINIYNPRLWSPSAANLYKFSLELVAQGGMKNIIYDQETINIGIRSFEFRSNDSYMYLNGEKLDYLVGTNRHQEYPYVGYALSDQAQYRDAYKIKQAGFNLVRCSHYPPSPAFLDACDRLGLLVINAIPGWQFFGNETFQKNSLEDIRQMVRRDCNHPSIVLWEASLNESPMSDEFMARAHALVKEDLPDALTNGWIDRDGIYDVFTPARQHGRRPNFYRYYQAKNNKPILLCEYGDWEYYADEGNFNQTYVFVPKPPAETSRQRRSDGERQLLKQAHNFQEAHNDNRQASLTARIVGDANWLMFDYKRGYAPDIEASGIMDINRLPKFAFFFYQSQCISCVPMIFIASYWTNLSNTSITIYSNCEHVNLQLNGVRIVGPIRQQQDSSHLLRPPFIFKLDRYIPGRLEATGFIDGKLVVRTHRSTPRSVRHHLKIELDLSGQALQQNDLVFVYAYICDENDTVIPDANDFITFALVSGRKHASLIGENPVRAEAGIASIILKTTNERQTDPLILIARSSTVEHNEAQLTFRIST